jgi:hypothetical protein
MTLNKKKKKSNIMSVADPEILKRGPTPENGRGGTPK